jgi:hypothetical protein
MLKDICIALGINEQVTDPEVFKFKPARLQIGVQSDKYGQFDNQNRIKRVRPLEDVEPTPPTTPPKPTKPASPSPKPAAKTAPTGPGTAPWKRPAA